MESQLITEFDIRLKVASRFSAETAWEFAGKELGMAHIRQDTFAKADELFQERYDLVNVLAL